MSTGFACWIGWIGYYGRSTSVKPSNSIPSMKVAPPFSLLLLQDLSRQFLIACAPLINPTALTMNTTFYNVVKLSRCVHLNKLCLNGK
ncbi:hypothetical protein BpHYR1_025881 [Brachionus plicatilis]|uniref:Uncharacterized protein n=1 Tax=Brachionus plicatilis TaxID=10195 RepID=A0A3M7Q7X3_BRAPC|nr:hypothetical protein BpHYR1_025881 [Brachionus plicatilis]